ncbi:MAG: sensor domain-containing diguanylate cyclase, partial [Gammaproteobacteria bacterium]|nr:sensor domain-containing diguanylate cyclase [Gammaproteobacteria bacterium]
NQPKPSNGHVDTTPPQWSQAVLRAIVETQAHFDPAATQSETAASVLAIAMRLLGASSGLLAFVRDDEPYRLHDDIDGSCDREQVLEILDDLAYDALHAGTLTYRDGSSGSELALLLQLNKDTHGIMALTGFAASPSPARLRSLQPFTTAVAAVLRQFQDDLSSSQVGAVIDSMVEGILTFDDNGVVRAINAAAEQVFGYNAGEIEGQRISLLVAEPFASELDDNLQSGSVQQMQFPGREFEGRRRDGTTFPMDVSLSQIEIQGRNLYLAVTRDMTEWKAREEAAEQDRQNTATLEQLARIDAVTAIANRRHFDEVLGKEVRRSARDGRNLALILCDIDFFKAFNDRYGHPAGDKALHAVAQAIDSCFKRAGELAARYGGEEFGVVIAGADADAALVLSEKMQKRVAELAIPHGASPVAETVTLSIGIASVIPGPHYDPLELVSAADRALYQAKGSGRNRVVVAEQATHPRQLKAL